MENTSHGGFWVGRESGEPDKGPVGFSARMTPATEPEKSPGRPLVDVSDAHAIVFAPTGSGKKRNVLMPTLLSAPNPVIVLDVKGELARESADYRRSIGHEVCILDPWGEVTNEGQSFNPLDVIDAEGPNMADDVYALASLLVDPNAPLKEAFWDESAQSANSALMAHVVTSAKETDRSLGRIWDLANSEDVIYGLASLLDNDVPNLFARAKIAALLQTTDVTRSGIVSTLQHHLRPFGGEAVRKAMATTSFDLNAVREGRPLSIYIVVPPAKLRSHARMLRLWMAALMNLILERKASPALPTLLLLDELAQVGRMEQVVQAVTLARGYGMRCMLLLQSHAQLRHAFPTEHETLMENCSTVLTFGHSAFSMSRQLADALGDASAEQLFGLSRGQIAVRQSGRRTRVLDRLDYLADPEFAGRAAPNPMFSGMSR